MRLQQNKFKSGRGEIVATSAALSLMSTWEKVRIAVGRIFSVTHIGLGLLITFAWKLMSL